MGISANLGRNLIVISFILILSNVSKAGEPNNSNISLEYVNPSFEFSSKEAIAVGEALGCQNWPKTNIWRVAPDINKLMLEHRKQITMDNKYYSLCPIGKEYWASCDWEASILVENNETITELPEPEEVRNKLIEGLAPELRNNPDFMKRYWEEKLERYRNSRKYSNAGTLRVQIYNTPNSKAAHECLLINMTNTSMSTQMVIRQYLYAEKLNSLGTMNYVLKGGNSTRVDFIRDNIYIRIRGDGQLSNEAIELAKKIDSEIIKSPAYTYEQLISRRPVPSISSDFKKGREINWKKVSYSVDKPNEVNIVYVKAQSEGHQYGIDDGQINFGNEKGTVHLKLLVISNELLVGECEKTTDIPDDNEIPFEEEPEKSPLKNFKYFKGNANRDMLAVADALGFKNWPKSKIWRLPPDINKSMLIHPEKVTNEPKKEYSFTRYGNDYWGNYNWVVYRVQESKEPLPTELPEEMKNKYLEQIPPKFKNDPNYAKNFLNEMLQYYRQSLQYPVTGCLNVSIFNTPDSNGANEYLLLGINAVKIPKDIISQYMNADKIKDLGTMNYVRKDGNSIYVDFIRDNLLVRIQGKDEFSDEAIPIAKKIDTSIVESPKLTYEQLISRKPKPAISSKISKFRIKGHDIRSVSFSIEADNGIEIVSKKSLINQEMNEVRDLIKLPERNGTTDVKFLAITNELLVGECERTFIIPDSNEESK